MSTSYDFLRPEEHVVFAQAVSGRCSEGVLPCIAVVVLNKDEGAVLVSPNTGCNSNNAAIPLYSEVKTSTDQTDNGFRCRLSLESSTQWPEVVFETDDIVILQTFLQEVKRIVALADDLNLHAAGRSHQWLAFYRSLRDDVGGIRRPLQAVVASTPVTNPFLSNGGSVSVSFDERAKIKESYVESTLKRRKSEYTESQDLLVKCTTWNIAGKDLVESLGTLLYHDEQDSDRPIQLYSMAFQEVDVSAEAYLTTREAKQQHYQSRIEAALGDHYGLVGSHQLVGILLCIYAHKSILPTITNIEKSYVACGLLGMVGNKGAVGLRLNVMNTSFAFLSCHLAAGQTSIEKRNADLRDIEKRIFNEQGIWDSGLDGVDHVFLSGDLNYRLSLLRDEVDTAMKAKNTISLLQYDQLNLQRKQRKVHRGWQEDKIDFPPTYKFDIGTDEYDNSEKQRVPSWTDRILTRSVKPIDYLYYTSVPEYVQSDHKPVAAAFKAQIQAVLTDRENAIRSEALRNLDRFENEATPSIRIKSGEDQIDFQAVHFATFKTRNFTIQNTGNVLARFSFIPKTNSSRVCKRWIWPQPMASFLRPQEEMDLQLTICTDFEDAQALNAGHDQLYDVLVLHVEDGTDSYISVKGDWQRTCIGQSLEVLSTSRGQRSVHAASKEPVTSSIPREISRICDYLTSQHTSEKVKYFAQKAVATTYAQALEALDTDQDFDLAIESTALSHTLCDLLSDILSSLTAPVIPEAFYDRAIMADEATTILDILPSLNANILIFLRDFFIRLIEANKWDERLENRLSAVFGEALMRPKMDKTGNVPDGSLDKQTLFITKLIGYGSGAKS